MKMNKKIEQINKASRICDKCDIHDPVLKEDALQRCRDEYLSIWNDMKESGLIGEETHKLTSTACNLCYIRRKQESNEKKAEFDSFESIGIKYD